MVNIAVSGGPQPSAVQVFNVMGSLVDVLNPCDRSANGWNYLYPTAKLPEGLYYIVIQAGSDKMVRKLVITQ